MKRIQRLIHAAENCSDAAFTLADGYECGYLYYNKRKLLLRKNKRLAFHWMHHAAQLGDTSAMLRLANYFLDGYGCVKNPRETIKWEKKAFRTDDNILAAHNLGCTYRMLHKYKLAFKWFMKSYTSHDKASAFELGKLYLFGQGVKKSNDTALQYFRETTDVDAFQMDKEYAVEFMADIRCGIHSTNPPRARRMSSSEADKRIGFYKDELLRSPKNEAACY